MSTTTQFFDRPEAGTRAFLVHVENADSDPSAAGELAELVSSAGLAAVGEIVSRRAVPDPRTFLGSGKVAEIAEAMEALEAQLLIVDEDLSPSQERNLEGILERRVLGRTGLILDIFSQRARTHEGKLQVELALLQHVSSRLVRGWTHLDRQRGGSGRGQGASSGLGGAGETQLEADQRMVANRIRQVNQRLARVKKQRGQNRRARTKAEVPTVSLVGYTNAGKSTLFNGLTESAVHAANQLFATLDPTLRRLDIPSMGEVVLSDTVGFIRKLPHSLIEAFSATLEEVCEADLLLHVVDVATPNRAENTEEVNRVLGEIGAEEVPQLLIYNKVDLTGRSPRIDRNEEGLPVAVWVSARAGDGLDLVQEAIAERLTGGLLETCIQLGVKDGQLRSKLYDMGAVISENSEEDGRLNVLVRLSADSLDRLQTQHGVLHRI